MKNICSYFFLTIVLVLAACQQAKVPADYAQLNEKPAIYPDYIDVTVPVNIAPLHFLLQNSYDEVVTRFKAGDTEVVLGGQKVMIDQDDWQELGLRNRLTHKRGTVHPHGREMAALSALRYHSVKGQHRPMAHIPTHIAKLCGLRGADH